MIKNIVSTFQLFASKGLPVAIYRMPGEKKPVFIAQKSPLPKVMPIRELDDKQGFVVAGFVQSMGGEAMIIQPDFVYNQGPVPQSILHEIEKLPNSNQQTTTITHVKSKVKYMTAVHQAISSLKAGNLQKVVLSRVHSADVKGINMAKLFTQLTQKYPEAFVYFLHLPGFGFWIGATPETLLSVNGKHAETVALAGTTSIHSVNWTYKEREEQEIVSTFIETALNKEFVLDFIKVGPVTMQAGKLAHLKTSFSIPLQQLKGKLGSFIHQLHPTPAVCGLPKERAFNLIQEIEPHQRHLYTGFLGPWNCLGASHLFVNLRCAKIEESTVHLFVGGGITARSNAEDEWTETVNKSETLLSVLKNL